MTDPAYPDALPAQSRLHWYVVERVLGQGGFGITYLARDTNLDRPVAIKEYLPVEAATRMPDATIRARTEELRDRYRWGLERFIQEARTLARFDHQNIVHVHSVFEFNNTAYMVMRFESGMTLAALLDRRGTLPENDLLGIILPVLDGLELVHNAGFIHRDIKPDNILIGGEGTPVLLDFGSARQALGVAHTLTILVAPGYAPFEQYYSDSGSQGPWTDIYGLGATCYRAIAGRPPLDAVSRSKGVLGSTQDVMVPATIIGAGRYSGRVLAAIDHALAFAEKDRPQSLAEWRAELVDAPASPLVAPHTTLQVRTSVVPLGASDVAPADSPVASAAIFDRRTVTAPAATPLASRSAEPGGSPDARLRARWSIAGVVIAVIAGAGLYVFQLRDEARSRSDQIQALIEERDRGAAERAEAQRAEAVRSGAAQAEAERVAKQKADAEVRQRQEQDARIAQEKDKARRRELDAKAKPPEKAADPAATAQKAKPAEKPPQTAAAPPSPTDRPEQGASAAPYLAPIPNWPPPSQSASMPSTSPIAEPTPAKAAPAVAETAKPAPSTVAEQFATADRAMSAGRFADAIAALKPLADAGDARAQLRLGDMYAEGRGTARDAAAARSWYEKAALAGNTGAQMKLGAFYANASGAAHNDNFAYMWYGTAARLGATAAKAESDRIGALLQPAERAQADRQIESTVRDIRRNL